MDRQELHSRLVARGVNPKTFDVLGTDPDPFPGDIYVLRQVRTHIAAKPNYWVTYYSERGEQHRLQRFPSEDEACRHFLKWVVSEQSACSNLGG